MDNIQIEVEEEVELFGPFSETRSYKITLREPGKLDIRITSALWTGNGDETGGSEVTGSVRWEDAPEWIREGVSDYINDMILGLDNDIQELKLEKENYEQMVGENTEKYD